MSKQPLISIAMATYNGEKYLKEQLDSILSQTYSNIEIIICDDYSGDATRSILEEYSQKDKRIKLYFNEKNIGYVKNFEKAISLCSGEFIALSDQDDIWMEYKIETLYKNIGSHLLIHSDALLINEKGNIVATSYSRYSKKILQKDFKACLVENNVTGCTLLFDRKLIHGAVPFPQATIVHDWWLALCACKCGTIKYLDLALVKYRQHENNQIGATCINSTNPIEVKVSYLKKYIPFLESLYHSNKFSQEEKRFILDLMNYYNDYFFKKIRLKSFFFHLGNFKYFNQGASYFLKIRGLIMASLGEKVQKEIFRLL